jgi:hypothetical protein
MAGLMVSLQLTRLAAAPTVTNNMIQLSVEHGMSAALPIGLTYFGQHIAACEDIEESCRYVSIARKL